MHATVHQHDEQQQQLMLIPSIEELRLLSDSLQETKSEIPIVNHSMNHSMNSSSCVFSSSMSSSSMSSSSMSSSSMSQISSMSSMSPMSSMSSMPSMTPMSSMSPMSSTSMITHPSVEIKDIKRQAFEKLLNGNFSIPELQVIGAGTCIPDLLAYSQNRFAVYQNENNNTNNNTLCNNNLFTENPPNVGGGGNLFHHPSRKYPKCQSPMKSSLSVSYENHSSNSQNSAKISSELQDSTERGHMRHQMHHRRRRSSNRRHSHHSHHQSRIRDHENMMNGTASSTITSPTISSSTIASSASSIHERNHERNHERRSNQSNNHNNSKPSNKKTHRKSPYPQSSRYCREYTMYGECKLVKCQYVHYQTEAEQQIALESLERIHHATNNRVNHNNNNNKININNHQNGYFRDFCSNQYCMAIAEKGQSFCLKCLRNRDDSGIDDPSVMSADGGVITHLTDSHESKAETT